MNSRQFFLSPPALLSPLTKPAFAQTSKNQSADAALLARHDIVYLSPTSQKSESLPIGNGDLVGMVTMGRCGLEFVIHNPNLSPHPPNKPPLPPTCPSAT